MLSKGIFLTAFIFTILIIGGVKSSSAAEVENNRITFQIENKPLYSVFVVLMNKYNVAIGLEESSLDRDHFYYDVDTNIINEKKMPGYKGEKAIFPSVSRYGRATPRLFTLNFDNASLSDVMDSIVKQMEHYDWEMVDGVVNIYPKNGRDARLERLLNLEVKNFIVGMGAEMRDIQPRITLFMPEFKEFLRQNCLEASPNAGHGGHDRRKIPDGMHYSGLTLKELLNKVTKFKRGGWTLSIKNYSEEPDIDFVELMI